MSKPTLIILDDHEIGRQTGANLGAMPEPGSIRTVITHRTYPNGKSIKREKWEPMVNAWVLFLEDGTRQYDTREDAEGARMLHGYDETGSDALSRRLAEIAGRKRILE